MAEHLVKDVWFLDILHVFAGSNEGGDRKFPSREQIEKL